MRVPKGFIKDSNGVYRRGNYIFKEGQITKESAPLLNDEAVEQIVEREYQDLDKAIADVLQSQDYKLPRDKDVYIMKSGDTYKASESKGKDLVAIITTDNNVYDLTLKEIPTIDDKELKPDKDEAKAPEQSKEKVTDVEVKDASDVVNLSEAQDLKEYDDSHVSVRQLSETLELLQALIDLADEKGEDSVKAEYNAPHVTCLSYPGIGYIPLTEDIYYDGTNEDYFREGHVKIKEGEQINQEQFVKLMKQVNDLEIEQLKAANSPEDVNKAHELRNLNVQQIMKSVNLSAPTDEELEQAKEEIPEVKDEPVQDDVPMEEPIKEEAEGEETTQSPELKTAMFTRRPQNIQEVEKTISENLVTPASYKVVKTITMNEKEFNDYCNNLKKPLDVLKDFNVSDEEAVFTCIAIQGPDRTLLIDNSQGNSIAQYVSIV